MFPSIIANDGYLNNSEMPEPKFVIKMIWYNHSHNSLTWLHSQTSGVQTQDYMIMSEIGLLYSVTEFELR